MNQSNITNNKYKNLGIMLLFSTAAVSLVIAGAMKYSDSQDLPNKIMKISKEFFEGLIDPSVVQASCNTIPAALRGVIR